MREEKEECEQQLASIRAKVSATTESLQQSFYQQCSATLRGAKQEAQSAADRLRTLSDEVQHLRNAIDDVEIEIDSIAHRADAMRERAYAPPPAGAFDLREQVLEAITRGPEAWNVPVTVAALDRPLPPTDALITFLVSVLEVAPLSAELLAFIDREVRALTSKPLVASIAPSGFPSGRSTVMGPAASVGETPSGAILYGDSGPRRFRSKASVGTAVTSPSAATRSPTSGPRILKPRLPLGAPLGPPPAASTAGSPRTGGAASYGGLQPAVGQAGDKATMRTRVMEHYKSPSVVALARVMASPERAGRARGGGSGATGGPVTSPSARKAQ